MTAVEGLTPDGEYVAQASPDGSGGAVLSVDGTRRYLLTRRWSDAPLMAWVMLNPSTADATADDPTIKRCMKRARAQRAGGIAVVNLFSLRATDPRELARHRKPVGPGNDEFISLTCLGAGLVVVAWGDRGSHLTRDLEVTALLGRLGISPYCLGITATGQPRHPGRMSYSTTLRPYAVGSVT